MRWRRTNEGENYPLHNALRKKQKKQKKEGSISYSKGVILSREIISIFNNKFLCQSGNDIKESKKKGYICGSLIFTPKPWQADTPHIHSNRFPLFHVLAPGLAMPTSEKFHSPEKDINMASQKEMPRPSSTPPQEHRS